MLLAIFSCARVPQPSRLGWLPTPPQAPIRIRRLGLRLAAQRHREMAPPWLRGVLALPNPSRHAKPLVDSLTPARVKSSRTEGKSQLLIQLRASESGPQSRCRQSTLHSVPL